jgi:Uncharacterized small protein (DUF2158)
MTVEERLGNMPNIGADFGKMDSNERYRCQWFAGSKLESGIFPVESLVKVESEDGGSKQ